MSLETVIASKVRNLSPEKQKLVLESIEQIEMAEKSAAEKRFGRTALIGMFQSGSTDIAENAEAILAAEIDNRSGWTIKK